MRSSPSVILWDVMDTLVRDPFFTHVAPFFGLSFDELLSRKHPTAWGRFELGQLDEQALYTSFFRDGSAIDGPGLKRCMADAYAWIDGIEPLLRELTARDVPMHALSNYSEWYRLIDERLSLSEYVELSFISCRTGVRKPAREAYVGACAALQRAPEECLFIDDREHNCEAARAAGLVAVRFDGDLGALRNALTALGFLAR